MPIFARIMGTEIQRILSNIKHYMEKNQEKTETFAKKIGLSSGELSKILRGERQNFIKHLDKFSKALGVSLDDLLKVRNEDIDEPRERAYPFLSENHCNLR